MTEWPDVLVYLSDDEYKNLMVQLAQQMEARERFYQQVPNKNGEGERFGIVFDIPNSTRRLIITTQEKL